MFNKIFSANNKTIDKIFLTTGHKIPVDKNHAELLRESNDAYCTPTWKEFCVLAIYIYSLTYTYLGSVMHDG